MWYLDSNNKNDKHGLFNKGGVKEHIIHKKESDEDKKDFSITIRLSYMEHIWIKL